MESKQSYYKKEREEFFMGERDLTKLISNFEKYVAEVKKTETKEQSRAILRKTGVLTKNGNVKREFQYVIK